MEQIFKIDGFHCEACVKVTVMKLRKIADVHEVDVQADGTAKICAGREISLDEVRQALDGLGYVVNLTD